MDSQTLSSQADLEFAETALRDVLSDAFKQDAGADAKSLDRMLGHIVNMHAAVGTSPERHANVAKRLGDFAVTTARMAGRHPDAASKLARLSRVLEAASSRMRNSMAAGDDVSV